MFIPILTSISFPTLNQLTKKKKILRVSKGNFNVKLIILEPVNNKETQESES